MSNELTLKKGEILREILQGLQLTEHSNSLARSNPERWFEMASSLAEGNSQLSARKAFNTDWATVKRVERQISGNMEIYRLDKIENLRDIMDVSDDITSKSLSRTLQRIEEDGEIDAKDLKEINVTSNFIAQRSNRLEGLADVVVEHRHVKSPEELKKEFEEMFMKDAIDAEVVDE